MGPELIFLRLMLEKPDGEVDVLEDTAEMPWSELLRAKVKPMLDQPS